MQRVASADTPQAQVDSLENTVFYNSLRHVFRTGGLETTVAPQMGRDDLLVESNNKCENAPHDDYLPIEYI